MDPLSVVASVAGLLMAIAHIASKLNDFISGSASAPSLARSIHDEIRDFFTVLSQLQPFVLGSASPISSRASMIDVDQLMVTLTGCVCTFSELEKAVSDLWSSGKIRVVDRMKWAWAESNIAQLVQRLQNHKASLTLMLTILTWYRNPDFLSWYPTYNATISVSSTEATDSMNQLCNVVGKLVESNSQLIKSNAQMSNRLKNLESQLVLRPGTADTSSITSVGTVASVRRAFEKTLLDSRVYRIASRISSRSMLPLTSSQHTGTWSVLSAISLGEISNISVLELPISTDDLYNPPWYGQLSDGDDPTTIFGRQKHPHSHDEDSLTSPSTIASTKATSSSKYVAMRMSQMSFRRGMTASAARRISIGTSTKLTKTAVPVAARDLTNGLELNHVASRISIGGKMDSTTMVAASNTSNAPGLSHGAEKIKPDNMKEARRLAVVAEEPARHKRVEELRPAMREADDEMELNHIARRMCMYKFVYIVGNKHFEYLQCSERGSPSVLSPRTGRPMTRSPSVTYGGSALGLVDEGLDGLQAL